MSEHVTLYMAHRQPLRGFWRHFVQLLGMTLSFLIISVIAVFNSFGYQINWQAHTIQQTGSIYINIRNDVPAQIYVNSVAQPTARPLTVSHLFPGQYTVQVSAAGYQGFNQVMDVDANTVSAVHNLVLIKTTPQSIGVDPNWLPIQAISADTRVQIKNSDELWVNKKFVTRTSGNIIEAAFYPDNRHVIYQESGTLWLFDLESNTTESLLSGIGNSPLLYELENSGQVLVYEIRGQTKAVSLY